MQNFWSITTTQQVNTMVKIKINKKEKATLPVYKTEGSAGADLCSCLEHDIIIKPLETVLVPTGLFIEIPHGFEAQIRPRSGLAINHNLTLLNSPGTIDSDYRGEIKIILTNLGKEQFTITHGMRIAQIVFSSVEKAEFEITSQLKDSKRGDGGFGHTGI
jgi:dUTP pyrophosphatase